ncbi:MAG: family N-acetyltransferase [Devosia sp.]|nr:family N-acetyltransferase [Devosia sp.]
MSALHEFETVELPTQVVPAKLAVRLTLEPVAPAAWDRAIANFDGVCQEQMLAFAGVRWASARPEPLIFRQGSEIVGGVLMLIQRLPFGVASVALTKWGPMLKDAQRADAGAIHAAMIDALVAEYADRRGMLLSVMPRVTHAETNAPYEQLIARGFTAGPLLRSPDRYFVNLQIDDAAQRQSLSQTWRRKLNKAEKAGLSFERAGAAGLAEFEPLFRGMIERKNFTDHTAFSTVPGMLANTAEALRPEVFLVRHEGVAVAGGIVFAAGDTAVYLYGATSDAALPLNAGYFLQAQIVAWLRRNAKARWYNLGGTDGAAGLHQFKHGLIGSAGVIRQFPPTANYAKSLRAKVFGAGALVAREKLGEARRGVENLVRRKTAE